jgi:TPR repeat protein
MRNRNQKKTVNRLSADQFGNFDGVLRKFEQAKKFKCCHKAAEQGDTHAQLHLGWCYAKGEGIRQDYAKAVRWFRVVAEQGDARAQLKLGMCYGTASVPRWITRKPLFGFSGRRNKGLPRLKTTSARST